MYAFTWLARVLSGDRKYPLGLWLVVQPSGSEPPSGIPRNRIYRSVSGFSPASRTGKWV